MSYPYKNLYMPKFYRLNEENFSSKSQSSIKSRVSVYVITIRELKIKHVIIR